MKYAIIAICVCLFSSCESSSSTSSQQQSTSQDKLASQPDYPFSYRLDQPDATFKLHNDLVEISGLSLSNDPRYLLAVNDEEGKVFFIDKKTGEIEKDEKFGKSGDYEGVEMVGDMLYAVRNSGTIVAVENLGKEDKKDESYNTALDPDNDVEGLCFDSATNRLLLACKGEAGKGGEFRLKRAVYGFDLEKKELVEDPVFIIDREEIRIFAEKLGKKVPKLIEILAPDSSSSSFAPSGIAIHPITKDIYLISSVGKVLVILNPDGKIVHLERLDSTLFRQPEGICFEADGTMYIASEGKGGKGRLFRFNSL